MPGFSQVTFQEWDCWVPIDNHRFTLFWAPLDRVPRLASTQDAWLDVLRRVYPGLLLALEAREEK